MSVICPSCHTLFHHLVCGSELSCSCGAILRVPGSDSDSGSGSGSTVPSFNPSRSPRIRLPGLDDVAAAAAARRVQNQRQNQNHLHVSSSNSSYNPEPVQQTQSPTSPYPVIPPRPERIRIQIPAHLYQDNNNNSVFVVTPPDIEVQGSGSSPNQSLTSNFNHSPRSPSPTSMAVSPSPSPNQMDSGPSSDSDSSSSPSSPVPNQEHDSSSAYGLTGYRRNSPVRRKSETSTTPSQNNRMDQNANSDNKHACHNCSKGFNLLKRWKHKCRSCKKTVCSNCSRGKWPPQMLPRDNNYKNEKALRVCTTCQDHTEQFRRALLTGSVKDAVTVYATGVVQLHCPYQIYPEKMYPLHCAVYSGSIDTVRWLLSMGCSANVYDARGYTPLSVAAVKGHQHMVKFFIFENLATVKQITDARLLQKCLSATLSELFSAEKKLKQRAVGQEFSVPKTKEAEERQLRLALRESAGEDVKGEIMECVSEGVFGDYSGISASEDDSKESETKDIARDDDCIVCFERTIDSFSHLVVIYRAAMNALINFKNVPYVEQKLNK
eukprot:CAMPEP_0204836104 /NCGR_PEP_ID=MMETSP1346-20131115/24250_1 /ASSEMBLY_ACC=CAM_ASM_000771 /TAXON_ID=215587 /ORGANISM="Aplanochytrium stocchinoi, Strain GSBS06" /LENGTH=548 /DNA_ID=CAMNT_0051970573 /DNA_START=239 /DNA_END=1889 /DNA_ORIENTATION=-